MSLKRESCFLNNVLYAPDLHYPLTSVRPLRASKLNVTFSNDQVNIARSEKIVVVGIKYNPLYVLEATKAEATLHASPNTWRVCLDLADPKEILQMYQNAVARNKQLKVQI